MGGGAEHAPQGIRVGTGTDAEAEAPASAAPGFGQGHSGIGFAIDALVAMVVREPIGQHDEKPPRRAAPRLEHRGTVADGRTHARVTTRDERSEPLDDDGVEAFTEALHGNELDR